MIKEIRDLHRVMSWRTLQLTYFWSWWLRVCLDRTYFAETENWKHCSKIVFKCVNSAVGPIFNEKIDKKWNLWVREQCIYALFTENWSKVAATVYVPYMNNSREWGENAWKKKKKKRKTQKLKRSKRQPKHTLIQIWNLPNQLHCTYTH